MVKRSTYILHDVEHLGGASLGCLHLVTILHVLHHVIERYPGVGHPAKGVDFPQQDPETPHVRLVGELGPPQSL